MANRPTTSTSPSPGDDDRPDGPRPTGADPSDDDERPDAGPPDCLDIPPPGDEDRPDDQRPTSAGQPDDGEVPSPADGDRPGKQAPSEWQRPVIARSSELHLDADKAIRALIVSPDVEIYSHGQALVEVVRIPGKHPQLSPFKRARLQDVMSRSSQWMGGDAINPRQIRAPRDIAEILLSRPDSGAAILEGIVVAPTMRPDGSILDLPGYDSETRLLFEPSADFPPIPEKPSPAQVQDALRLLRDPFREFPWLAPCDESATLAGHVVAHRTCSDFWPCSPCLVSLRAPQAAARHYSPMSWPSPQLAILHDAPSLR